MENTNKQHHEKLAGVAEFVAEQNGGERGETNSSCAKQTVGNERERPGRH